MAPMYLTDESDAEALRELILSKKFFRNQGKNVETHCTAFEREFAQYLGLNHSLLVTSGTNALICALSAHGIKAGDEVIVPGFTFFATAVAVANLGAIPVIVNIDEFLSIDVREVEAAITEKTKAIIAVHMDGRPCDMDSLLTLARKHNLALIEDVAQAVGGKFRGKKLGSLGDSGCFSFNVDKIISCGEGGAYVTNSRKNYEHALCVQDACCSFGPTFKDSFSESKPFIGMSMRISEIQGLLIRRQLLKLEEIIAELKKRQHVMKTVLSTLSSHDEAGECGTCIYLRFNSPDLCSSKVVQLAKERIVAIPINARPAHAFWQWMPLLAEKFGKERYHNGNYLNSIDILRSCLKINTPFEMSLDETERYAKKIKAILLN